MNSLSITEIGSEALIVAVMVASPMLLVALIVGLVIGVVQAATSINEMTLSFIPTIGAMVLVMIGLGSWQISVLVDFTRRIFERIPTFFM